MQREQAEDVHYESCCGNNIAITDAIAVTITIAITVTIILLTILGFQPFISQFFTDRLLEALPYCNIVIGNEGEAEAFGKSQNMEDCSPLSVCKKIASWPQKDTSKPRICIITQGANETIVVQNDVVNHYKVPQVPDNEVCCVCVCAWFN